MDDCKAEVEGILLSSNWSENSDDMCSSSLSAGNDDGVPIGAYSDELTQNITINQDFLEKDDPCRKLIIEMSDTKCRLTLLRDDGICHPVNFLPENFIPLRMALIRKKVFVFGTSVESYMIEANRDPEFRQHFLHWDLGKSLLKPENIPAQFIYHHRFVPAKVELLFGLFLNYLKTLLNSLNTGCGEINQIVFAVPLWFTSLHRQRLKDAAKISGFEDSTVVNAISALAALHLSYRRLTSGTSMNLTVLSENSGNVDIAFFSCEAGVGVTMLACTGNQYDSVGGKSEHTWNLIKQTYETVKGVKESAEHGRSYKMRLNCMTNLLGSLYRELQKKLPNGLISTPLDDVLCFCEQKEWQTLWEKLELMKNKVVSYEHLGASPLTVFNRSSMKFCADDIVLDLIPYDLYRFAANIGKWEVKLFQKDAAADNETFIISSAIYPTTYSKVYQKNIVKQRFEVGTVFIKRLLYFQYPQMEIRLKLGKEGIFQMNSVHACNENGDRKWKLENSTAGYLWKSGNLTAREEETLSRKLMELAQINKQYQLDFIHARDELWNISQEIAERLWNENHRLNKRNRVTLKKKVDRILTMVRRSTISPFVEVGTGGLEYTLKEMQSKYMAHF